MLRNDLIQTLGMFGGRPVIDEAFQRFEDFRKGRSDLSPDLRRAVAEVVGRYSSSEIYEALYSLAQQAPLLEAKQDFYHALGTALDPELAKRTLQMAITLPPAESRTALSAVALTGEHADLVWQFTKEHWDNLQAQGSESLWSNLLPKIAEGLNSSEYAEELERLAGSWRSANSASRVKRAVDQLRFRAGLKDHLLPDVDDWVLKKLDGHTQAATREH